VDQSTVKRAITQFEESVCSGRRRYRAILPELTSDCVRDAVLSPNGFFLWLKLRLLLESLEAKNYSPTRTEFLPFHQAEPPKIQFANANLTSLNFAAKTHCQHQKQREVDRSKNQSRQKNLAFTECRPKVVKVCLTIKNFYRNGTRPHSSPKKIGTPRARIKSGKIRPSRKKPRFVRIQDV